MFRSAFTNNPASRNLWDYENREVYESSHSVVLALLAAHAERIGDGSGTAPTTEVGQNTNTKRKGKGSVTALERPLAEKIVPFYTSCLLEVRLTLLCCASWLTYLSPSLCFRFLPFHHRIPLRVG